MADKFPSGSDDVLDKKVGDVIIRRQKRGSREGGSSVERKRPETKSEKMERLKKTIEGKTSEYEALYGAAWRRVDRTLPYDGKKFEASMLGVPGVDGIVQAAKRRNLIAESTFTDGSPRYIIKQKPKAMSEIRELIKEHQAGNNPDSPADPFASRLQESLLEKIGGDEHKDKPRVRYFTSVGTPLDHSDGTDCFFEITNGGVTTHISLDLTLQKEGKVVPKADVVVREEDVWPLHEVSVNQILGRGPSTTPQEKAAVDIFELQRELIAEKIVDVYEKKQTEFKPYHPTDRPSLHSR